MLKTLDATLAMSVPTSGTTGIVMDIRKDDGSKLFNINESGDTTIAGNLKFDGDMDLADIYVSVQRNKNKSICG